VIRPREPQPEAAVAAHYDELDGAYRELWGEHVHHGLWRTGRENVATATAALTRLVADHAAIAEGARVCDVGCGYGGTARLLARERAADVTGFTLSAAQAAWAGEQGGGPRYVVGSWLDNKLPGESMDAVLAIESVAHMADKAGAMAEAARVLRPGGRLAVVDWLAAPSPGRVATHVLLEPICREGRLPSLGSAPEYSALMEAAGLVVDHVHDLSRHVWPTWPIVTVRAARRLATDRAFRASVLDPANGQRDFIVLIGRLLAGFATRSFRIGLISAHKPAPPG
jgi:tocopherol O-methyltransferase